MSLPVFLLRYKPTYSRPLKLSQVNHNHKTNMKNSLKQLIAGITALIALVVTIVIANGQDPAPQFFKPAYRILITDSFEGYQYEPVAGTTVIYYLQQTVTPEGDVEWNIDQIAGPWGNSKGLADPDVLFDSNYAIEFLTAYQEAERTALWRGGFSDEFEWTGRVVDVREHIKKIMGR